MITTVARGNSNQGKEAVEMPSGLVAVYKPKDWSSNQVVGKVKWLLRTELQRRTGEKSKLKVGHGGTLDPMAEGVLVLGIGKGTKLLQYALKGSKGYRAVGKIGEATDTLDSTGNVTISMEDQDISAILLADIENALPAFRGDILQIPPMFSALKKDGQRLYKLAREGIEVEREARPVTVYGLKLHHEATLNTGQKIELPQFCLDIECSGGFYVRTLLADVAESINSVAHMTYLLRTKQGDFTLDDCIKEEDWNFEKILEKIKWIDPLPPPDTSQ